MTRDEIEAAVLRRDADVAHEDAHEDARDWYMSYGWHLTTDRAGDVVLQAVEYGWLTGSNEDAVAKVREAEADMTASEAESLVAMARSVREAAESICGLLDEAVDAYARGDLDACRRALLSAHSQESDHGDTPATDTLAEKLLEPIVEIGEWGYADSTRGTGTWYAPESCREAVQTAYDAMDSDDLGPDCDRDIIAAGGIFRRA